METITAEAQAMCQAMTGKYVPSEKTPEEKMKILEDYSLQLRTAMKTGCILCADCKQERPVLRAYKCFFCGRWFCPACARHHFT